MKLVRQQSVTPVEQSRLSMPIRRMSVGGIAQYCLYALLSVATLGPILWLGLLSFKTRREFAQSPFGLPQQFNFENYAEVFRQELVLTFTINSVVTVACSLLIVLVASTLAAYAIARIPFRGRNGLFVFFLVGDSVPLLVVIIPLFVLIQRIGLQGSRFSIILPYAAMNMGISIYILRGFFRSIHSDVEDAARLDGCNLFDLIRHVILPIARPGMVVITIINFISYWNEYFLATVIAPNQALFTLPAGLAATFVNKHSTNWPVMSAAVVLTLIPMILVFTFAQDKIVRGWTVAVR